MPRLCEIYWTDARGIHKAAPDESDPQMLIEAVIGRPGNIVLGPDGEKIYWTDQGNCTVRRANLDGSDIEIIVDNVRLPCYRHPGAEPTLSWGFPSTLWHEKSTGPTRT